MGDKLILLASDKSQHIMDNDCEEVVREPFEEEFANEDVRSNSGSASPSSRAHDLDQRESTIDESDQSEVDAEDAKFANQYGITLKNTSRKQSSEPTRQNNHQAPYDRLLNSVHIRTKESTTDNKDNETKGRPAIRQSSTSECIYHRGTFYQKGDIVTIYDQDDGRAYFAQLVGFLQDQYCEKSASLMWLVPTRRTSREIFDPSAYRIGLEDPQLRKLDCMSFVCHCPHDYYLRKLYQMDTTSEASTSNTAVSKNPTYIWTTLEPCKVPCSSFATNKRKQSFLGR